MSTVLFNLHDVMLLITVYLCVLFAILLLVIKKGSKTSNLLLALFLLSHAAIPIDNLILFGEAFRASAIAFSPNIFYVFGTAYWVESVFLLFYVKSLIYKNFTIKKFDYLYFLPFVIYVLYEWFAWFSLSSEIKLEILNGYHLEEEPGYVFIINLFRECFRVFCTVLCFRELVNYQKQIKNKFADIEAIDLTWLKILIFGFLIINVQSVIVTVSFISSIELQVLIDYTSLGLLNNYAVLLLISVMIFFSLVFSIVFKGIEQNKPVVEVDREHIDPALIKTIVNYMVDNKPYLDHLLTLDSLSAQLLLQPRLLSQIINRHFKQNFFEFINAYRIDECKLIIKKLGNEKITMLQVMDDSGFNSKATFNTFFKKLVGMTPTQYRKENVKR